MRRLTCVLFAILAVAACARASEATLEDVVEGRATPENFVRATVIDTREADELLVELSRGEVTVWTTGFTQRPGRGAEVWTAFVGPPVDNDLVGLTYPTAGSLEPPKGGLTETGALAVIIGLLALTALLVPAITAGATRLRGGSRCSHCATPFEDSWITCTQCGSSLIPDKKAASPTPATVFSAPQAQAAEVESAGDEDGGPEADPTPPAAGTRIIREGP